MKGIEACTATGGASPPGAWCTRPTTWRPARSKCQHAQRCPGLAHLPLPKGGYCITAVCKDGSFVTRTVARTKANAAEPPTCHPTAAEAMSAAWRHVGGEIPQGRE